jgi:hypothetical protein
MSASLTLIYFKDTALRVLIHEFGKLLSGWI